jgi:hypothetical protein
MVENVGRMGGKRHTYLVFIRIRINLVEDVDVDEDNIQIDFILVLVPCIFYYFVQWTNKCTVN